MNTGINQLTWMVGQIVTGADDWDYEIVVVSAKRLILACGGDPDAPAFPVPLQELNCNVRVEQMS